jgi:radical SAM protein with 4Fe4S-binding SPASM domain
MNQTFEKHPAAVSRVNKGKPFILNYKTGDIMMLNDLGSVIWEELPGSLSKITDAIVSQYDVSRAEIQHDALEFLDSLKEQNLVVVDRQEKKPLSRHLIGELTHLKKIENFGIQECIPVIAKFELLYHCNLECAHCSNSTERWRKGTLNTGTVKHIIHQLYDMGTVLISFTGGEIFARKALWDIIAYADKSGFLIELLTNATLMTEADVQRLKNYRISNVQISIYSHIPALHDSITGSPGSYEKAVKIIRSLTANKINTSIVTALMNINFQDCKKIKELADELGVEHSYLYPVFERDDGSKDVCDLRLSKDQVCEFFLENPGEIPLIKRGIHQPLCYAGTNQCSISPFGDVFPCFHNILPINLGNLKEQSLEHIWTHSKDLENFRALKMRHLKDCSGCPAVSHCSICPGLNMRANNQLLEPAGVCCDYAFSAKGIVDKKINKNKEVKKV